MRCSCTFREHGWHHKEITGVPWGPLLTPHCPRSMACGGRQGCREGMVTKTGWVLGSKLALPVPDLWGLGGQMFSLSASLSASLKWGGCVLWCWGSGADQIRWWKILVLPQIPIPLTQPETRESRRHLAPLFLTSYYFCPLNLSWIHPVLFLPIALT